MSQGHAESASVVPAEVARFAAIAEQWWDPHGKFAPLHRLNPVRLGFIRDQALARFGRHPGLRAPFMDLSLLDIGCGGGLVAEPMSRLGFAVTAVDAGEANIAAAAAHAARGGLSIDYRCATAEALADAEARFDVVINLEVVEHVADPQAFLATGLRLLAPGGLMIVATLNRTMKAFALAKVGAEYVLGWLPRGAHDWNKFLTPAELRAMLEAEGASVEGPFGVRFSPVSGRWALSEDASVNYMVTATLDPPVS